ncbi:MAG: ABC transporter ATP-binding protein [Rhodoferax sp.]|nr:ABC transporter ATP-binding protein [Rhodoferax sp.]
MTKQALLAVDNLCTSFFTDDGEVRSVDGVSLGLERGEVLGLVGESGSGKSVMGLSLMGLIDRPGRVVGGSIRLDGVELVGAPEHELRRLRGPRIGMIFQDPLMSLNPVLRIETTLIETLMAHESISRADAHRRALAALADVGIPSPAQRMRGYPHEMSGGMRQRVAIAAALLPGPQLLIADEPTTALDVTIQSQILHLLQNLVAARGLALIMVSHDLSVVASLADRVAVMYAGRIVESGPVRQILSQPAHPYTRGLIRSAPVMSEPGTPLPQIRGVPPSPLARPAGCAFAPRCDRASARCTAMPALQEVHAGHAVRCWHPHPRAGAPGEAA